MHMNRIFPLNNTADIMRWERRNGGIVFYHT